MSTATLHRAPLRLANVPQWGYRAREGTRTYEIERMASFGGTRGDGFTFRAYVRERGIAKPIASALFGTQIAARRWIEQQRERA